jgi:hypothetical protein
MSPPDSASYAPLRTSSAPPSLLFRISGAPAKLYLGGLSARKLGNHFQRTLNFSRASCEVLVLSFLSFCKKKSKGAALDFLTFFET